MSNTITEFDKSASHIYTFLSVVHPVKGTEHRFKAILDTGAPVTEFVDTVLLQAGIIHETDPQVSVRSDLQSKRYRKLVFPEINIFGRVLHNFEAHVARWKSDWGIGALIGLDFFRRFKVAINYKAGQIITEPYE